MQIVKNINDNIENDISRLLGSMKRVDPPGDFDVRVRARIAKGRPSVGRSWLPATASVTAAVVVVAAAGYFGVRSYYSPTLVQNPIVVSQSETASNEEPVHKVEEKSTDKTVIPLTKEQTNDTIAPSRQMQSSLPNELRRNPGKSRTIDKQPGGGTRVDTSGIPEVITGPSRTQHLTKEILSSFGIDANNSGSGWTVGDVPQNSRAQRSGLRSGDIVESIKNRSVRVRRDGKPVTITLVP